MSFYSTSTTSTVRQSRSIEDREVGKQFAPLWKALADQLKMTKGRKELENRFSNLLRLEALICQANCVRSEGVQAVQFLFHNLKTRFWMLVKRQMTFGPCQETSKTAITLIP